MIPVPAQFKAPAVAQVNLMPPEVGQRRDRTRRRGQTILLLALFLLLVAVASAYFVYAEGQARTAAAVEEQRTVELQAEIATYSEVDVIKARLANADAARQYAAATEFFWPLIIDKLGEGLPSSIALDEVTFGTPGLNVTPPPPESPFGRAPVMVITFSGTSLTVNDATEVARQLNTIEFFERARVTVVRVSDAAPGQGEAAATSGGATGWIIEGTVDVNYDALMMRYSPAWFGELEGGDSLEEFYQDFHDAIIAGTELPDGYPPLPPATPPGFLTAPPVGTETAPAAPGPTPSPTPTSTEGA